MVIKPQKIKIRDLVAGYRDEGDEGVYGYGGKLDIRPPYQREFVYDHEDRLLVIDSVMHGFPLNAMYWIVRDDGGYEVMDGQQRTISICQYYNNFSNVITWIEAKFKHTSDRVKILKGLDWGRWYAEYGKTKLDTAMIEKETQRLLKDKDVTKRTGIIPYLLTGDERHLSIRTFDDEEKLAAYERQGGTCKRCGKKFAIEDMQADHITPWAKGGKTVAENCQMLCADCNRHKSDI